MEDVNSKKKPTLEQKVVLVLAERSPTNFLDAGREFLNYADMFKLRLDCLEPEYLRAEKQEQTMSYLRQAFPNHLLMASVRHVNSVPQDRVKKGEGYQPVKLKGEYLKEKGLLMERDKDLERIGLIREATQKAGMQYFELEDHHRQFFILLKNQESVVIYPNMNHTPTLGNLRRIYDGILRRGADHIVIETMVRNKRDKGQADREKLFELAREKLGTLHPVTNRPVPLTIIGRGKYGARVNLEAYKQGISEFVYGIVESFSPIPIPFLNTKLAYKELPSAKEVINELGLRA